MTSPVEPPRRTPLWLRIAAPLFALALRALGATWRIRVTGSNPLDTRSPHDAGAPIGVAWHAGALVLTHYFRDRAITVGVSRSRDGDSISAVLAHLGYAEPVRGSTSSGGADALWQMVARSNQGSPIALLVDGPRGPAGRAKPGAVALARRTGRALTPIGCDAGPAIRFASWDRTLLPLPFARVAIHFGDPFVPEVTPAEADSEPLDRALEDAQALARTTLGDAPAVPSR